MNVFSVVLGSTTTITQNMERRLSVY